MKSRVRGFTLIELLVVVAIIALLIAILLPSLGRARDQAKATKCGVNMHSIYQGVNTYQSEWDGYMMPYQTGNPKGGTSGSKIQRWYGAQLLGAEFGKNSGLAEHDTTAMTAAYLNLQNVILHCPSDPQPGSAYDATVVTPIDYAYNANFGDIRNPSNPAIPLTKFVKIPRQTLMSIETHVGDEKADKDWYFKSISDIFVYDGDPKNRGTSPLAGRNHGGNKKSNMLFVDGSIILDDPLRMNTTGGQQMSILSANGNAGTDFQNVVDWSKALKYPFPFNNK